ncbi:restriction endonuclease subunit S [Staphylococcus capitis]|uniref:restriction endonuclease subunit S n=6 Tax=Staphylococcus TaxID=1279 RepID=UPI001D15AF9E|nr:restriction endonuclease subunit S [Staphylococcus capitis]MCC3756126.1 restriction endonuclease subunit S [Staphylococcus capitis]MDH8729134.1 restriction endonuclease subunit S [Staphylococcus capitis]MDH8922468.1 restriction endonuclease subunit S [Staphylococcus capitis]MDH8942521.1 restriction endonuclease subunit S [Staphylococcus capitis]MDH9601187.1 restriction endonuclease subunit S [Staphylococcus capitis]
MTEQQITPELRFPEFKENWEEFSLEDKSDLITKGTTPKAWDKNGKVNFVKVENIEEHSGKVKTTSKISYYEHSTHLKRSILEEGDILFSIAGTLGRITIINKEILPANTNQALAIIRNTSINKYYLKTYLLGKSIKEYIRKNPTVGAQPNLSLKQIKSFKIKTPDFIEQEKIGNFFCKLDRQIELEEEKLELLEQQKKGYMQKIFSQELRFKDERGNNHPSWKEMKLMEFLSVIDGDRGKNYPTKNDFMENGHTLFLSAANVTKQGFSLNQSQYITKEKSNSMGKGKLNINDVVLTTRGSIGNVFLYNEKITKKKPFVRINSGMLILRTEDYIKSFFITKYLASPLGKKQIDLLSFGSAQPQLTKKDIELYKIKLPVRQEQKQISLFLKKIDKIIEKQSSKVELLKQRKQGLLQKMFV